MHSFKHFGLSLQSLALFRGLVALVIVIAAFSIQEGGSFEGTTLLMLSMSPCSAGLIAVPIGVLGLLLLVGYRVRAVTILCFFACGLAAFLGMGQFGLLTNVLLPVLFWSCFLPLGAAYSFDSAMNIAKASLPDTVVSSATAALMIQQGINYWLPETLYWPTLVGIEGTGIVGLGRGLLWLLGILSPLLILATLRLNRYRAALVMIFVCIHLVAIWGWAQPALLHLLAIALWTIYIPQSLWQALAQRFDSPARRQLAIYYDADCGFCKKVVHILRTLLVLPEAQLATAQSDPSICMDMETYNSWVVVDWQQNRHFKFEAIAYICSLSPIFRVLTPVLRWKPIMAVGTRFYEAIANNRKRAGLLTKPFKFHTHSATSSKVENRIVCLCAMAYFVTRLPLVTAMFETLP